MAALAGPGLRGQGRRPSRPEHPTHRRPRRTAHRGTGRWAHTLGFRGHFSTPALLCDARSAASGQAACSGPDRGHPAGGETRRPRATSRPSCLPTTSTRPTGCCRSCGPWPMAGRPRRRTSSPPPDTSCARRRSRAPSTGGSSQEAGDSTTCGTPRPACGSPPRLHRASSARIGAFRSQDAEYLRISRSSPEACDGGPRTTGWPDALRPVLRPLYSFRVPPRRKVCAL